MVTMPTSEMVFLFLILPATVVWVSVVGDIVTRPGLTVASRVAWLAAVTLLLPTALAWLLLRPTGDPLADAAAPSDPDDPQVALVALVIDHDDGLVDDATFSRRLDGLLRLSHP